MQLSDGRRDVGKEHDVVHNLAYCHAGIVDEHQIGRKNDDEYGANLLHKAFPSVVIEHHLACAQLIVRKVGLNGQLLVALNLFTVERLDDVDALNDIDNAVAFQLAGMTHLLSPSTQAVGLMDGYPDVNRHNEACREPHVEIGKKHEHQRQQCRGEQGQQVYKSVLHCGGETAYDLVDAGLQLAWLIASS